MNTASVSDLKEELKTVKPGQLVELCLRLSRFKKENKELLTYLLFKAHNEEGFITDIKKEIDELFAEINLSHLYFAKKSLRKIVRIINKYCRYSGIRQTEVELRLYFCTVLKGSDIPIERNTVISNLYQAQLKKTVSIFKTLHEDLQYDYKKQLEKLS
ncbi:MAG: hypothetical protein JST09_04210 [Bacteroidetes bacterium]|nr:hypothetical protein [Bacteroidota bacterium]